MEPLIQHFIIGQLVGDHGMSPNWIAVSAAYGFASDLPLQSQDPADLAKVCNLIHALLHQQQRDTERLRDMEDSQSRLESSLQAAEQSRRRTETRLLAKDKEIGGLENKVIYVLHSVLISRISWLWSAQSED